MAYGVCSLSPLSGGHSRVTRVLFFSLWHRPPFGRSYNIGAALHGFRSVTLSGDVLTEVMWWYGDVGEVDVVVDAVRARYPCSGPITWFTVHVYTQFTAQWNTLPNFMPKSLYLSRWYQKMYGSRMRYNFWNFFCLKFWWPCERV
jgi:hypothetical protein